MSNKPNPESVAKVLAAGIVPGCRVRDSHGTEDIVGPAETWECSDLSSTSVFSLRPVENREPGVSYLHLLSPQGAILATIIEPAPALPDTFNTQAHSHLVTERKLDGEEFTTGLTEDPAVPYVANIAGRNYLVDAEANRIQFLDSRFYRDPESGMFVPSVTTILEAYPKGAQYYEWLKKHGQDADEIRDEAGRRGSVVHEATEVLDLGGELQLMNPDGGPRYKLLEWAMIGRYAEFRERFPATMHAVETKLANSDVGYAGTLDRLLTFAHSGKTYLLDIKTSGSVWPSYWLQQAAYHELLHRTGMIAKLFPDGEVPEIHLGILWLNANTRTNGKGEAIQGTGWQLVDQPKPTEELLNAFHQTLGLWRLENEGKQPRTTTYQLSLKINQPQGTTTNDDDSEKC